MSETITEKQHGLLITFEGIDGCGKSTQLLKVRDQLLETGWDVITTREPGGTHVGDAIREILLSPSYHNMTIETEILLYAASRVQHVDEVILPALGEGKVVICDRFLDSSVAYQGAQFSREQVTKFNQLAWQKVMPDITFFIDINASEAFKRIGTNKDRIENRGLKFQEQVRQNYLYLAKENYDRIIIVDGDKDEEQVFEKIWGTLKSRLY